MSRNDPPPSPDPFVGKVIEGRWRLIQKLGEGGMGAVYLAEQLSIRGRRVAVKLLHAEFAQNPEFLRRFRGEAERAAAVSDPRIVMVLDFGQAETGELFLVMEYVVGDTLADLMNRGRLPLQRALIFGAQLAEALHCVHEAGVIHRDVKPANAMVRHGSDDLKLMDFGIARDIEDQEQTHLTKTGIVVGTPAFMAPEQIKGDPISRQTDIYAWGVVMYAMVAGRRPFEAASAPAVQYMHVHEPPPALSSLQAAVPPDVERIVMRALAKAPEDRPRTMAQVAAALRTIRIPESGDIAETRSLSAERSSESGTSVAPMAKPHSRRNLLVGCGMGLVALGTLAGIATRAAKAPSLPVLSQPSANPRLTIEATSGAPAVVSATPLPQADAAPANLADVQTVKKPLSVDDLSTLLKAQVPSTKLTELVREQGVTFELTDDIGKQLGNVGATNELLVTIEKMGLEVTRRRMKEGIERQQAQIEEEKRRQQAVADEKEKELESQRRVEAEASARREQAEQREADEKQRTTDPQSRDEAAAEAHRDAAPTPRERVEPERTTTASSHVNCRIVMKSIKLGRSPQDIADTMIISTRDIEECKNAAATAPERVEPERATTSSGVNCGIVMKSIKLGRSPLDIADTMMISTRDIDECKNAAARERVVPERATTSSGVNCGIVMKSIKMGRSPQDIADTMMVSTRDIEECKNAAK